MLDTLLAHRFGLARLLGIIAGVLVFFFFEDLLHFIWYVSLPVGVLVYLVMAALSANLIGSLEMRKTRP
jgi:ABC-type branched-subunit amino acid transport system permease subunit